MPVQDPFSQNTAETAKTDARARVVSQTLPGKVRTYFEGLEKDARTFIQNNFPRPHVEPPGSEAPVPDVVLVKDDGSKENYHADNGWQSGDGKPEGTA